MSLRQVLLQSARVAELRHHADELAKAARPPARIALTGDPVRDRRRLHLALVYERQRNAKLLEAVRCE
jgi:hypothetical protein